MSLPIPDAICIAPDGSVRFLVNGRWINGQEAAEIKLAWERHGSFPASCRVYRVGTRRLSREEIKDAHALADAQKNQPWQHYIPGQGIITPLG